VTVAAVEKAGAGASQSITNVIVTDVRGSERLSGGFRYEP
jgi:hypothetical protein